MLKSDFTTLSHRSFSTFLSSPFFFLFFFFSVFFLSSSLTINTNKQSSSTFFLLIFFPSFSPFSLHNFFFLILYSLQILFLVGLWVEIGGFMVILICFCYLIHITKKYVGIVILVLVMVLSFYWA